MKEIHFNEIQSIIIFGIFLIGFFTSSWFILSRKAWCFIRGLFRSVRHCQRLDGHEYEELCTGANYWEDEDDGILGSTLDYEVLICRDCGHISVAYNYSEEE